MTPRAHIAIATPTYTGDMCYQYVKALALALQLGVAKGVFHDMIIAPGFSLVEYARNWTVAEFLKAPQFTHLMWIDADLGFQPDAITRLLKRDLDVVCGVYTTKHPTNPQYPYTALGPAQDGLQEAERVPGGFVLMKRHVIETVAATCDVHEIEHNGETILAPRLFDLRLDGKRLVGEDYVLCARLRCAGFRVFIETDLFFEHVGRRAWPAHLGKCLASEAERGVTGQGSAQAHAANAARIKADDARLPCLTQI